MPFVLGMSGTPSVAEYVAKYTNSVQQARMQSEVLVRATTKKIADLAHEILAASSELAPVQSIKAWFARLVKSVGDSISHSWASVRDFTQRIPGHILAGLKAAAKWLLNAPFRLIKWLWRVLRLGPILLGLAKWTAVACGILLGLTIVVGLAHYACQQYRASTKKGFLPGPNGRGRSYGTFDANWFQFWETEAARQEQQRQEQDQRRRAEQDRQQRERQRERQRQQQQQQHQQRERARQEHQERAQRQRPNTSAPPGLTQGDICRSFEKWLGTIKALFNDRSTLRRIPDPPTFPMRPSCDDGCGRRREGLRISFCEHSIKEMVQAYVAVHKLSREDRKSFIDEQKRTWHPDRFARCPEDVRDGVQLVAGEMMKIMNNL